MQHTVRTFDVVIAGGGMVGGLLAAALAQSELTVCVLERERPEPFAAGSDPDYDLRVSALSVASERMLRRIDAWQGIVARRACPFSAMSVWDGENEGRTDFHAGDIGAPALGHIVENRVIQLALLDVLDASDNVTLLCPALLQRFRRRTEGVELTLESGDTLTTRLLVGADGARSLVREASGIAMPVSPYPQHALVASIRTCLPQQSMTWQRFMPTGPQAFLPLCGNRASMVWYHDADEVGRLRALDDTAFAIAMENAFPAELGGVEQVLVRGSFPIARAHAAEYVEERIALIGDAAHVVHPLAGQGVNLGMMDAGVLAEVLIEAHRSGRDIGRKSQLRHYERWRRGENALMIRVLDGFHHAFLPRPAPFRVLRSVALDMADKVSPVKHLMMRQAMGLEGRLPDLARQGQIKRAR